MESGTGRGTERSKPFLEWGCDELQEIRYSCAILTFTCVYKIHKAKKDLFVSGINIFNRNNQFN